MKTYEQFVIYTGLKPEEMLDTLFERHGKRLLRDKNSGLEFVLHPSSNGQKRFSVTLNEEPDIEVISDEYSDEGLYNYSPNHDTSQDCSRDSPELVSNQIQEIIGSPKSETWVEVGREYTLDLIEALRKSITDFCLVGFTHDNHPQLISYQEDGDFVPIYNLSDFLKEK